MRKRYDARGAKQMSVTIKYPSSVLKNIDTCLIYKDGFEAGVSQGELLGMQKILRSVSYLTRASRIKQIIERIVSRKLEELSK